jgi:hypothetical protein
MLILAGIALSIGVVLGLKFKILALVPAITASFLAVLAQGIAQSDSIWRISVAIVIAVLGLQIGYVAGLSVREAIRSRSHGRSSKWAHPDNPVTTDRTLTEPGR